MLPGPAAWTVIRPQSCPGGGPKLASLERLTLPLTSSTAGASASTSAICARVSSQTAYAPPTSVSLPAVCTATRPYVPGARSHRPFPGSASGACEQSAPAITSTSFAASHAGNGDGKPHAAARSPGSVTHWPVATLQLGVPSPSASPRSGSGDSGSIGGTPTVTFARLVTSLAKSCQTSAPGRLNFARSAAHFRPLTALPVSRVAKPHQPVA